MTSDRVLGPDLSRLVLQLDRSSWVKQHGVVFGSALNRPHQAFDLDVAIVLPERFTDSRQVEPLQPILGLARAGTPLYGRLDLFVRFTNALLVRDELCRGFVQAKQARALRAAIGAGQPWDQWRASVALDPGVEAEKALPAAEPSPERRHKPRP